MKIIKDPSTENKILLFSHLIIRSLLSKQHQFTESEFSEFINQILTELDIKEFKGKVIKKSSTDDGNFKPVYKHQNIEEYQENNPSLNFSAYTGLFGVIFVVAVLYSIKNR